MAQTGNVKRRNNNTKKKDDTNKKLRLEAGELKCLGRAFNAVKNIQTGSTLLFNVNKNKKGGRFDFSIETSTLSLCWYTTYTASDEHNLVYKMFEILTVITLCTERTDRKEWLLVDTHLQSSLEESLPHHTMHTQLANNNYSLGKQPVQQASLWFAHVFQEHPGIENTSLIVWIHVTVPVTHKSRLRRFHFVIN